LGSSESGVRAQQAVDLANLDAERHARERVDLAVFLAEVVDRDHGNDPMSD
jgi:hypothetical protein